MQGGFLLLIASLCVGEGREITKSLSVQGGNWGTWGQVVYCPEGSFADGYKMKIEPPQGFRDDTSLNRVSLSCRDGTTLEASGDVAPHPHTKSFGTWGPMTSCQRGHFITSFALQVERPQGSDDDTAANFVKFTCRNITNGESYVMMQQPGAGYWGTYGPWSESCPPGSAVCGIQQKVEPYQSILGDDTELNNLKFYCCKHV